MKKWLEWAMELQFIAQAGITYSENKFDIERFERVRELSAEIVSQHTDLGIEKVQSLFCNETGYQTPKLDTRAVIIQDEKILLVKESSSSEWSLPGGWVDVNKSIRSNIIKETKEEAGLDVIPERMIAVQDRNKHNTPISAYGICKIFVLCHVIGGEFKKNIETEASGYFSLEDLPPLSLQRNNKAQIQMCFDAYHDPNWQVLFD